MTAASSLLSIATGRRNYDRGSVPPGTEAQFGQLPAARRRRIGSAALACTLALTPASAQRVPPADATAYTRAIAAGYKAAMYCSGIFTAGRTPAQIDADELTGIYPEYDTVVPGLMADVNSGSRTVRVAWSPSLPPREASWHFGRGCTLLPIGSQSETVKTERPLPGLRGVDPRGWPQGDSGIAPRPTAALAHTVTAAFDGATYGAGKTTGIVVVEDGKLIAEHYAPGWGPFVANRTWSVAKSISGTLLGMAGLDPAKPAPIPEWQDPLRVDPRGNITLDNLLRMGSGLHSGAAGNRTDAIYFGGTAVTDEATAWPIEAKPGTRFRYANDDILLAVRAMRATLGETPYQGYPATALFAPLGMTHTVAEQDWRGNYILSSQVWSTARDLARLGQFWLQDGVWQGKRLLPAGWVRYMTTPSGPQPDAGKDQSGPGYGATMWLFGPKQGLPADSYAAQGNRGQYVMVIPSEHLVVVRRGEDPGAARFDIARFTADVIAATHGDLRDRSLSPSHRP